MLNHNDNVLTVTIGSKLSTIGNYAFRSCKVLESVTIEAETPPIPSFNNAPAALKIYVPSAW
jgi:hypothetical protein